MTPLPLLLTLLIVVLPETYQFAFFFRKAEPHCVLLKVTVLLARVQLFIYA
jgi:hypothetical protein